MTQAKLQLVRSDAENAIDLNAVFNDLNIAIMVLDGGGRILEANDASEVLTAKSRDTLIGKPLGRIVPGLAALEPLAERSLDSGAAVTDHRFEFALPERAATLTLDIAVSPLSEQSGCVVVRMVETTVSQTMDRRLGYLGAALSVTGMASVLAHEVKNPLSGIRGAAQLLGQNATDGERGLTDLIRDEADRICDLVDRMGQFSNAVEFRPVALNIHEVLDRVHRLSENGFAAAVPLTTDYDPSLPPVSGDRDLLIQVFLNLVKNAVEAVSAKSGRIALKTSYVSGIHMHSGGEDVSNRSLPICIEVIDNGSGIPNHVREHLFDPFVTSKLHGSGLGLALTAKIINDHGGLVDFDSTTDGTSFRVYLPVHVDGKRAPQ